MTKSEVKLDVQKIIARVYKSTRYRWANGGALPSPKSIVQKIAEKYSIASKEEPLAKSEVKEFEGFWCDKCRARHSEGHRHISDTPQPSELKLDNTVDNKEKNLEIEELSWGDDLEYSNEDMGNKINELVEAVNKLNKR